MKKFLLKLLLLLAVLVTLGALGWRTASLLQQNRARAERPTPAPPEQKVEQHTDLRRQLEQQTSELRGLPFLQPVNYKTIERAEFRDVLRRKLHEQYTEEELHHYGRSLATLGLLPQHTDLKELVLGLYNEQVGAFYIPEEHALYTFKDTTWTGSLEKMLLVHELTHALQDQHFDLAGFPLKLKDNDDRVLAAAALIEGDATVLMSRWYAENTDPRHMLGDLGALLGQNTAKLRDAPPFLRELLLFPYVHGQQFAMTLFLEGGTEALDEAFRNPPRSTAEILDPAKFLRERAEPPAIEPPPVQSAAWRRIGNNVAGEFGIRSLLAQQLPLFQAQLAARGWRADRYHVYERGAEGPTALVWASLWENETEAAEFEEAYTEFLRKRDPHGTLRTQILRTADRVLIRQSADASFFEAPEPTHAH